MERIGLVLLVVVSFVAAGSIPEQHWAVQRKETVRKATIKVYSPVDNKFVGAINLSQLGANVDDLIVLGRLWGLLPGRYYGIVYKAAPGKVDNACASAGPAVMRYNAENSVNEELCLFDQSIGDDTERTIGWFALDASLSGSSSNNIGNHVVKIYAYSDKEESTVGSKPAVESPVACGVVNDKPLPSTYVEGFHDLEAVKAMEYRTLGKTGLLVSKLSFGGGPLGCHYGTFNEAEAIETIRHAIRQGVNYIDTAPWYGQGRSEAVIGKALQGIPRKAYYIATKIGRYELDFDRMFDFSVEKTRKSLKTSLELLQLDYVDVIQVHDIEFAPSLDIIVTHTLPELSKQVRDGKARFIGITGYPVSILMECIEKSNITISCVLTYSRYTLIDETLLDYVDFFKKNNIGIINAAGACMGLLTNGDPPEWHPASEQVRMECAKARQCCKDHDQNLARLAVWNSMQCESVATNLVGMQNMSDLMSNLDVMRNGISDKEKDLLRDLQEKYFAKMKGCHWEGCEIEAYRKATNWL